MFNRSLWCLAQMILVSHVVFDSASADQWGSIRGRFVYGGNPPVARKLEVNKDLGVCGKHPLLDESLVVGKDRGVANVVIYIRTRNVKIHPDLQKSLPPKAVLDNVGCRFEPHIRTLWVGKQTLVLRNSDPIGHNSNVQPFGEVGVNPLIPANGEYEHRLSLPQPIPIPISCGIHPWMRAHLVARDNPYIAVSGSDGVFKLEKLPAVELEFQAWQEKCGYVAIAKWKRGRFRLSIKPGVHDLGDIILDPKLFEK